MTEKSSKSRIIFIDILRAIAVFMMVQGHTTDTLLSSYYKNPEFPLFHVWNFIRGLTAPIFMFSSGAIFTYLLKYKNYRFVENPRVKKGIKRFLMLVFIGYMLRYPTAKIFFFSDVRPDQWQTFFTVDVLHLIGFSLLFIVGLYWVVEKFKSNGILIFIIAACLFFTAPILFENIQWTNFLPLPLANYFYKGAGSFFPLFPWSGFVITGGILGLYLSNNPTVFKNAKFSKNLLMIAFSLLIVSFTGLGIELLWNDAKYFWTVSPNLIIMRLGIVILLTSIISYYSLRLKAIPRIIILLGQNTLLIYVVHLIILYGSAWSPGLQLVFYQKFDIWLTLLSIIIMFSLMIIMVLFVDKHNRKKMNKLNEKTDRS